MLREAGRRLHGEMKVPWLLFGPNSVIGGCQIVSAIALDAGVCPSNRNYKTELITTDLSDSRTCLVRPDFVP